MPIKRIRSVSSIARSCQLEHLKIIPDIFRVASSLKWNFQRVTTVTVHDVNDVNKEEEDEKTDHDRHSGSIPMGLGLELAP